MDYSIEISKKAISLAKLVLKMTTHAGSGHPSTSLSLVHIITALMYNVMRYDPQNPWNPANDRLVLSEGHAVPIIYAAYADLQGAYGNSSSNRHTLTIDDLDTLRQINSPLDGHPNPSSGFTFFDCATGSLGQGLSCAAGLALAANQNSISKKIYCIIGDGESREGQIWEACDFIIDYNLHAVVPIFNCNGLGQTGPVSHQQSPKKLADKLNSFGFIIHTIDGHNPEEILKCLKIACKATHPHAIIAKTIKGWGVPALQNPSQHGKPLKETMLAESLQTLDSSHPVISPVHDHRMHPPKPEKINPQSLKKSHLQNPDFQHLLKDSPYLETYKKGLMSTRRAFGLALKELAAVDQRIIALDADVSNSTFSQYMAEAFPQRFIECRIAEQNMLSVACGLSAGGYIPFVSSFAKFLVRSYDQLELAAISKANIKLCGSHSGANIAADGPSQMGLSDLGYMRTLSTARTDSDDPLVTIFNPCCAIAAYKCVGLMADLPGICYLRTIRMDLPLIYSPEETFEPGGIKVLNEGSDIAIMASGYMVHPCKKVIEDLAEAGISASLYDCYSIPVNQSAVKDAALKNQGKIVTVEDNFGNGLGAEITSVLNQDPSNNAVVKQLHVKRIPKSGISAEDVFDFAGIGI
ncbi:MAG TPA: transketolase [Chitinispirillaceae bacterium]|nr:transketolase [Chitinispirillaceae bacterium]